jgi:hypothetical protein
MTFDGLADKYVDELTDSAPKGDPGRRRLNPGSARHVGESAAPFRPYGVSSGGCETLTVDAPR